MSWAHDYDECCDHNVHDVSLAHDYDVHYEPDNHCYLDYDAHYEPDDNDDHTVSLAHDHGYNYDPGKLS